MPPPDHPMIPNTLVFLEDFDNNLDIILKYRTELKPHFEYLLKRATRERIFDADDLLRLKRREKLYQELLNN